MYFKFFTILILIFLVNLSCATNKTNSSENNTNLSAETNPQKMDQKEQYPQAKIGELVKETHSFDINKVEIVGNYMIFEVSYSGGCAKHDFELVGSSMVSKSNPPTRVIQLQHNNHNDKCKAIITEKLKFSISVLALHTNFGNIIQLDLWNNSLKMEYTYD
jgi:hypothetical protein